MSRNASRASLLLLVAALPFAMPACDSAGDRPATVSKMNPLEAAAAAARVEESAMRTVEVMRKSFRQSNDFASCFDTLEIDGAELCGDDYLSHFLFEWSDCFGTGGRILIDNARDTVPAGAQCQAPTGYSFDHASAYDFTAGLGNGGDHTALVTVDASGLLAGDGSPREVASDVSVHAMGTGSAGALVYDATVDSDWALLWATNGTPTLTASGASHVHLTALQRDYQVTATGLTFRDDCCHPVAGTVAIATMVASSSFQATASFGPACGDAVVDGTAVTLAPCGP